MTPKYEGKRMVIGGREFIVPALSIGQVRRMRSTLEALNASTDSIGTIEHGSKLILAALSRNYPDITADELDDLLDMRNVLPVLESVMGQSGLKPEDGSAGEAPGAAS